MGRYIPMRSTYSLNDFTYFSYPTGLDRYLKKIKTHLCDINDTFFYFVKLRSVQKVQKLIK
jgi:hypothetical protein